MPSRIPTAGLAGLTSIAAGMGAAIVDRMWTFPGTGATGTEVAAFVHAHRQALLTAMVLNTAAITLWLVFGAGVWIRLRPIRDRDRFASACLGVGLVAFVTLLFAGFTAFFVLVYRVPGPSASAVLYDLTFGLLAMSGMPTALALGAYASLALGSDHLPRWTAWLAVVGAVAHLTLLASFLVGTGFVSLEGGVILAIPGTLFAWIAGTAAALVRAAPVVEAPA